MANSLQVALLEDHPVLRSGVKLSLAPLYHVALEAGTAAEFFEKIAVTPIDVAILDLCLPDLSGIEVARQLKATYPHIKILIFSVDLRDETMQQLLSIGVDGYLSKNSPEEKLQEAVAAIAQGETYYLRPDSVIEREILVAEQADLVKQLSPREHDIMLAFCKGLSCAEVAAQMYLSPRTVDNHKQHIFAKLGIHNVVELLTFAVKNKIIILS